MATFCEHCGKEISPQAVACPACGHPRATASQAPSWSVATQPPVARRFEPYAAVSLACSIANFIALPLIGAILGVIFGNVALDRIRQDPTLDGAPVAQAGRIIGYVGIAIAALFFFVAMAFCSVAAPVRA